MNVQPHLLNLSAYINQNLEKDLPLSRLAERVGLSPFHFHRKFGAYFGESLHQHIKRLRLERAAFSLVNGSTPVRQIARDSGYKTVSAFSHAFSGFAGESPTRYRSVKSGQPLVPASRGTEPAWVGVLEPVPFAFVRAKGNGPSTPQSIGDALELIHKLAGPLPDATSTAASADDDRFVFIAATCDLYGVSNGGNYRLDVGLVTDRLPAGKANVLGVQTLPGGRYARFDFTCPSTEVVECALAAALHGLKGMQETPRLSQYFLRFEAPVAGQEPGAPRDFQFFVPLAD